MPSPTATSRAYKEVTLQQLRSFCETARLGSFTAAAASLGVAHPTVWKQVHALERQFEAKLVETDDRGCRLTEAGRLLADLAAPAVTSIAALKRHFLEAVGKVETRLTVAAPPRVLVEDLPDCVLEFEKRWSHVWLTFLELRDDDVATAVEAGDADVGFTPELGTHGANAALAIEPCYEMDLVLITPHDHPLARRRQVRPRDLSAYPLVNSSAAFHDAAIPAALAKLGMFQPRPRRVEAYFAVTICRYVELGFGIGLIYRAAAHPSQPRFHERRMSRYFGRATTYVIRRKGAPESEAARAFTDTVRTLLNR
jgi:DNA-binding transcriptional LysR family regulator